MNKKFAFVVALLAIGLISRFIPHYPNFTAIGAMAIMGGAVLKNPLESILLPLGALFVSDLIINNVIYAGDGFTFFYASAAFVYGAVLLSTLISRFAQKLNVKNYLGLAVITSIIFFFATNMGTWATGTMYPKTAAGLIAALVAGIPYAFSFLAGTVVYGVLTTIAYGALIRERKTELAKL